LQIIELLNEFYRSRADFTYDSLFKRYTKFDLLILGGPGGKVRDFSQGVFSPLFIRAVEDELILK